MHKLTISLIFTAFFTLSEVAGAAGHARCAGPQEMAAMQISALQQRFMVAALSCGSDARADYNAFQQHWKPVLQAADRDMLHAFRRIPGAGGEMAYHRFKTSLAAKAELNRIQNSPLYCSDMHNRFTALEARPAAHNTQESLTTLGDFAGQVIHPYFTWPVSACAETPHSGRKTIAEK